MKPKLLLILLILRFCAVAQNLNIVPNWSFEDTIKCDLANTFGYLKYWYDGNNSIPIAIHVCNDNQSPSLVNEVKRHSGYCRVAFYLYATSTTPSEQREYIGTPLKQALVANKKYCLDFYTLPAKESKYGCNSIGAYFAIGNSHLNTYVIPPVTPQSNIVLPTTIADTSQWYHYIDIYTATGGETDMVIGNFMHDNQINVPIINNTGQIWNGALYVIDDVSLHEMSINAGNDAVTCPQNMVATIGETNQDTAFKNYWWYDASGTLIDSIKSQIQVQPVNNTFYVQEKRMCGQSLWDTVFVKVDTTCPTTPEAVLTTPNIFSPNGDGINDVWQLQIDEYIKDYSCTIYNRYGTKMFQSFDKKEAWAGRTTSGVACSDGIYYYIVEFTNSRGEIEKHKGYISLIR